MLRPLQQSLDHIDGLLPGVICSIGEDYRMLQIDHLKKSFGDQDVLRDVSFEVSAGQRVGLVGANGVGKSTVLKAILGTVECDSGQVRLAPHTLVAYLPQDACVASGATLHEEMLSVFQEVLVNEHQQRELECRLSQMNADDPALSSLIEAHARLQEEFDLLGGYEIEAKIGKVLHGLGFQRDDYDKACHHFSGGWQMRIALAKLLLQNPDLLLLDEPTNHLDLPAITWLENHLREYRGTLIVVSHDRFFLDRVTQRTVELENGCTRDWPGNYSYYVAAKSSLVEQQKSAYERQQVYLRRQQAFVDRFRASARRSAQAKSREKMLSKIERLEAPRTGRGIHFRFPKYRASGREVVSAQGVAKAYDGHLVFADCNLTLERGDRLALVGENGAGKTTLLRLLAGEEQADRGTIKFGYNVHLSYYTQHQADSLSEDATILDEVYESAPPDWTVGDVRDLLGAFLFSGDAVFKRIGVLSGGERSRVALAKMLLRPANLLLLDEPTNHLDIPAREMLETALREYEGTVVVVSHDRYFLSKVANRVVELADEKVRVYDGDYAYYLEAKERAAAQAEAEAEARRAKFEPVNSRPAPSRQISPRKLLEALESEIVAGEEKVRRLEQEMADPELYLDGERARQTVAEYNAEKARLAELNSQWEELALAVEAADGA